MTTPPHLPRSAGAVHAEVAHGALHRCAIGAVDSWLAKNAPVLLAAMNKELGR